MKRQLIPEDIDHIMGLIEQIADAVLKSDYLSPDEHLKVLQKELDLYLAPRWAALLQCSSWGFQGGELRKAIECRFLGIPAGYRLFPPKDMLPSAKLKVIRELERIRAKLEYDMQHLISSKAEAGQSRTPAESGEKEIVEVKPGMFGITVNIKEIAKRIWKCICSRRKG